MTEIIQVCLLDFNKGQLTGLPKNPRFFRDYRFEAMKKSIQDSPEMLELRELIVFPYNDGRYIVVCGNLRLRACKELGYKELPCKILAPDTPVKKLREYATKDNVNFGENDLDVMENEWNKAELQDWGIEFAPERKEDEFKERFDAITDDTANYPLIPKYDEKHELFIMPCKIVIPSHKRHDRVFAKKLVNDPIICVAESQADLYQQFNPECEIVTHPDDVMGLIPKRNWMAKHFGELFMLDDDVHACKPIYVEKGEPSRIKDKDKITNIIQSLFEMASMMDVHLFGFTARISPVMYDESAFLSLSKMITGCSYGVIYNKNTWWNEEIRLKEDFWISCYMKYKERKVLTDLRYNFEQKNTFVNAGGLASIRNQEEERKSILFIKKNFGDSILLKSATTNGKDKTKQLVQYNISCKFKF